MLSSKFLVDRSVDPPLSPQAAAGPSGVTVLREAAAPHRPEGAGGSTVLPAASDSAVTLRLTVWRGLELENLGEQCLYVSLGTQALVRWGC